MNFKNKFWGIIYYMFAKHLPQSAMFYSLGLYKIGKVLIIGAGAIVTKDLTQYATVGGNPAKVIKYRNENNG